MMKQTVSILDIGECIVRDERGLVMANLYENDGVVIVKKTTACSIGMYFYILRYLKELGFDVR